MVFFAFLEVTFKKVPDKATSTNRPKDKLTEKPTTLTPSKSVLASPTPKLSSRHYRQDKTNGKNTPHPNKMPSLHRIFTKRPFIFQNMQ